MDFTNLSPDEIRELLIAQMQKGESLVEFENAFYTSVPEAKGIITRLLNGTDLTSAQVSVLGTLVPWQVIILYVEATNNASAGPEGPRLHSLRRIHKTLVSYVLQAFSTSPTMKRLLPATQPAPTTLAGEKPDNPEVGKSE